MERFLGTDLGDPPAIYLAYSAPYSHATRDLFDEFSERLARRYDARIERLPDWHAPPQRPSPRPLSRLSFAAQRVLRRVGIYLVLRRARTARMAAHRLRSGLTELFFGEPLALSCWQGPSVAGGELTVAVVGDRRDAYFASTVFFSAPARRTVFQPLTLSGVPAALERARGSGDLVLAGLPAPLSWLLRELLPVPRRVEVRAPVRRNVEALPARRTASRQVPPQDRTRRSG